MALLRSLRKFYVGRTTRVVQFLSSYFFFLHAARSYPYAAVVFFFLFIYLHISFIFPSQYFQKFEDCCCDKTLCRQTDRQTDTNFLYQHNIKQILLEC